MIDIHLTNKEANAVCRATDRLVDGAGEVLSDHDLEALVRVVGKIGKAGPYKPGKAHRKAVWAAWNTLPDGAVNAVQAIAADLGLPVFKVAAVVYPADTFGESCPQCGGAVTDGMCAGYRDRPTGCGWVVGER